MLGSLAGFVVVLIISCYSYVCTSAIQVALVFPGHWYSSIKKVAKSVNMGDGI